MIKEFKDLSTAPILAVDFDGTINKADIFPDFGEIRPHVGDVLTYLHDIGVIIIINTCRDVKSGKHEVYDDITPMIEYLRNNNIPYDGINTQFAPYKYDARKVYAHMYVDDKAFGWSNTDDVFLYMMRQFMRYIIGFDETYIDAVYNHIAFNGTVPDRHVDTARRYIKEKWENRVT